MADYLDGYHELLDGALYSTVRLIERDDDALLAWACEP
jgi:hypothetical protein